MRATLILLLFSIFTFNAEAHVRTNVNEVTDLFEKNIENKEQEFRALKKNNDDALDNISSEGGYQYIQGMDKDVNSKISELNSIRDMDLDNAGRDKRHSDEYKFYDEGEFEPDYTKPGNKMHREDAMTIAIGTRKKLDELLTELNKIGVDCKTVKGPKQKESQFFIDIQRAAQKNTEYDLFLCEEPRNQYQCDDSVSLTCKKKGMKWNPWDSRTITMLFQEIPSHWWIVGRYTDSTYHGRRGHGVDMGSRTINTAYNQEIAAHIANKINASPEQVQVGSQDIVLTALPAPYSRNVDLSNCIKFFFYHPNNAVITFTYQFRTGEEICEQWSEDWTERCTLK